MKVIAIIPARMNSSRFPGKPMTKIHGIPMIGHCFYRIKMCKDLLEVYVATCDDEIVNYIESMIKIEEMTGGNIDVVVMVQGDEPMITPEMITDAIQPFDNADTINVVNLMANIKSVEEFEDPNEVKVVVDNESNAVYFSREPIPSRKKGYDTVPMLKQVCVIPFKRDYLLKFNKMEETELERIESVDMMRIIENGEKVHMVLNDTTTYSVDTEQDKRNVENSMVGDLLLAKYKL